MQLRRREARLLPRNPLPRVSLQLLRSQQPQLRARLRLRLQQSLQRSPKPPPRRITKETVAVPS